MSFDYEDFPSIESINPHHHLGFRPYCPCCGGKEIRGRKGKYSHNKATSRKYNRKNQRSKPKSKDH